MDKQNRIKNFIKAGMPKRIVAFFLAITIGILPVFYNSVPVMAVETIKEKLMGKRYVINDSTGMTIGGHHFDSMIYWTINGEASYCFMPGYRAHSNDTVSVMENVGLDKIEQEIIWYILYYGNRSGNGSNASYAATQGLIWLVVLGKWNDNAAMEKGRNILDSKCDGTKEKFNQIWEKVKTILNKRHKTPSFTGNSVTNAQTHELKYNQTKKRYEVILEDKQGMLNEFDFSSKNLPDKVYSEKVSTNKICIYSSKPVITNKAIKISLKENSELRYGGKSGLIFWIDKTSKKNQGQVQYTGADEDPWNAYFHLTTGKPGVEIGKVTDSDDAIYTIEVDKTCAETQEGLGGISYDVFENENFIGNIVTDQDGKGTFTTPTKRFTTGEVYYIKNYAELVSITDATTLAEILAPYQGMYHSKEEAEAKAKQEMEEFKNQTHTYKVVEKGTRQGYLLHGNHPDDQPISEITISGGETASFEVQDHRVTGHIKMKKEDLETITPQGDATLAGAVYGLYAASPIEHPDGHTGLLYNTNELVSVATTNENGGADFSMNTEGKWKGKPLLLGQYYIKEISRSEGYEMSITGINYENTNRDDNSLEISLEDTGSVKATTLYIKDVNEFDDHILYFDVTGKNLTKGYDIILSGLPEGTFIYKTGYHTETVTKNMVTGIEQRPVLNSSGNAVYQKAEGGELKLDLDGNPIIKTDGSGNTIYTATPVEETYMVDQTVTTTDTAISTDASVILDQVNNQVIIKKEAIIITGGGIEETIQYPVVYENGFFEINIDASVTVNGKEFDKTTSFSAISPTLIPMYEPEYATYTAGENLLDEEGNPIPEMEEVEIYEDVTYDEITEARDPVAATYNNGTYTFHVNVTGNVQEQYVVVFPNDCSATEMQSDTGVTVATPLQFTNGGAGSYVKYVILPYQGGKKIVEDAGTFTVPIAVKERVIKQPLKITKTISKDSYKNNTYGIEELSKLPDFSFKVYLISDLIDKGLKLNTKDEYDYKTFFKENPALEKSLARKIDTAEKDKDNDLTTVHASENKNEDYWYATTTPLPYGHYVIVEQISESMDNKYYDIAKPIEVVLPFIPEAGKDKQTPSSKYKYDKSMSVDEMQNKYNIRLGIENDTKYGSGETVLNTDRNSLFNRQLTDYDKKFLSAFIPWSVVEPSTFTMGGKTYTEDEDYDQFVGYAYQTFENIFYSSKLRIEKLDSETGENIIHDGATFKIYKAQRDEVTGDVLFDDNDNPIYDEKYLITQYDPKGNEVGIFKAFSTITEVMTEGGIQKQTTGYIETYEPIGAGVYVLVEVQAPKGYATLQKPVAVEIYSDKVSYYPDGKDNKQTAEKYEYAIPLEPNHKTNVNQIKIHNKPLKIAVKKVEKGKEIITYEVEGSEEELTARKIAGGSETVELQYDENNVFLGYAIITHTYDKWSENKIIGTETELKNMPNVRLVYDENNVYQGYGVGYDIAVEKATLTLYEGLQVEKDSEGRLKGIQIIKNSSTGAIENIVATHTGSSSAIMKIGKTTDLPKLNIYDTVEYANESVNLLFYDLTKVKTENDEENNLYLLDSKGNRSCMLDRFTGLAYVLDEKGNTIVYPVDDDGEKIVHEHIRVQESSDGSIHIYSDVVTENDENGLPIYYESGHVTLDKSTWKTDKDGKIISRIGMGAYILEETLVPYAQGYIQAQPMGFIVGDTEKEQKIFMEDDFTKIELSKRDITSKEEISGAAITLYEAEKVEDDSEKGYHLEIKKDEEGKAIIYEKWISGETPHWVDHIPVGCYIMEETIVPYLDGYVKSENVEVVVLENGLVQQVKMEDDYTSLEIVKTDPVSNKLVTGAGLTLYKAELWEDLEVDKCGVPILNPEKVVTNEEGVPIAKEKLISWVTGEMVTSSVIQYNKDLAPNMKFHISTTGAMNLDYIPAGFYVLEETEVPFLQGYTTAKPMLIEVKSVGHKQEIQIYNMKDYPTTVQISKVAVTGGKEIKGAVLSIYKIVTASAIENITNDGIEITTGSGVESTTNAGIEISTDSTIKVVSGDVIYIATGKDIDTWASGDEGFFTKDDDIPEEYEIGDLKPHIVKYLPIGDYILIEERAPFGVLIADHILFTIEDTKEVKKVEMVDEVPLGRVKIHKVDGNNIPKNLAGAEFEIIHKETGKVVDTLITDENGFSLSTAMSIGYVNDQGKFQGENYIIKETKAPQGYVLNNQPFTFQFTYEDDGEMEIIFEYTMKNYTEGEPTEPTKPKQPETGHVKISKQDITSKEELAGAHLVVKNESGTVIEEWISTPQPHFINDLPTGTYTLTETLAPDGYLQAEMITFEIKGGVLQTEVIMFDDYTKTAIHKINVKGEVVIGAVLELREADGKFIDKWVSTVTPHAVNYLSTNKEYILSELKPPAGYVTANPVKFKIKDTAEAQKIVMVDEKTKVKISKQDITGDNELEGAKLTIFNEKGKKVESWVSTTKPHYVEGLPIGKYTLKEEIAPFGYTITTDIKFEIKDIMKIQKVVMKDDTAFGKLKIKKIDQYTKVALPKVTFELLDEKGKVLETLVTDTKGYAVSKNVYPIANFKNGKYEKAITYILVETKALTGYKLDKTKHTFQFKYEDGKRKVIIHEMRITNVPDKNLPQTGDNFNGWMFLGLGFAMVMVGAGLYIDDRKKTQKGV